MLAGFQRRRWPPALTHTHAHTYVCTARRWEAQTAALVQQHSRVVAEVRAAASAELAAERSRAAALARAKAEGEAEGAEVRRQMEEDVDQEVEELKERWVGCQGAGGLCACAFCHAGVSVYGARSVTLMDRRREMLPIPRGHASCAARCRRRYRQQLQAEGNTVLQLKGENGLLRKRFGEQQDAIEAGRGQLR